MTTSLSTRVEGVKTSILLKVKRQLNQMKEQKNNFVKSINIIRRRIMGPVNRWCIQVYDPGRCTRSVCDLSSEGKEF